MEYTKQTPAKVREWLRANALEFQESLTLPEVAEESRRRYLSNRWSEIEALRCVTHWAAHKLAMSREFTSESWDWIAGAGSYTPQDHYMRFSTILQPAIAQGPAWRKTDTEKAELLREIGDKARDLLRILETEQRLDIDFRGVVGLRPEMQPLLDREFEIQQKSTRRIQLWRANRRGGIDLPLPPPEHPGFIAGPRLSDYLSALIAEILGQGKSAPYNFSSFFSDDYSDEKADEKDDSEDDGDWEIDDERVAEILGIKPAFQGPFDPSLLRDGGDFGKYPNRADALRSAVIRAFPAAIFERMADPPSSTPASVIESACIIWFGASPTQKEINAMIKPDRDRLERAMARAVNGMKKREARRTKWRHEGLSEADMEQREFQSFLDDE